MLLLFMGGLIFRHLEMVQKAASRHNQQLTVQGTPRGCREPGTPEVGSLIVLKRRNQKATPQLSQCHYNKETDSGHLQQKSSDLEQVSLDLGASFIICNVLCPQLPQYRSNIRKADWKVRQTLSVIIRKFGPSDASMLTKKSRWWKVRQTSDLKQVSIDLEQISSSVTFCALNCPNATLTKKRPIVETASDLVRVSSDFEPNFIIRNVLCPLLHQYHSNKERPIVETVSNLSLSVMIGQLSPRPHTTQIYPSTQQ
ncbi:hypothetical protein K457DRAFT_1883552 [Linnemannia elongata AG-77]|uniref:Uncharacterized protein n=1 Tax=Linnemannia elongata AG-77 TaxID=1314771 RepID=A0A197KH02_9FUNG|nr:hypothetical protein K457DRAFT_1883552 [Linnemannia elongata AG-77]